MSKVEELMQVVRDLPEEQVNGLLELARTWAANSRHADQSILPIRMGGMAMGWDTPLADIRRPRQETWTIDGDLP